MPRVAVRLNKLLEPLTKRMGWDHKVSAAAAAAAVDGSIPSSAVSPSMPPLEEASSSSPTHARSGAETSNKKKK